MLILAAITASFVGVRRRLRRPVLVGAALGLLASVLTWVLAQTLLQSLERYGEKLEAVVGLIAIGVLLLITNWFFHKVYWSEWIGKFHRRRKQLERASRSASSRAGRSGWSCSGSRASTARASRRSSSCSRWSSAPAPRRCSRAPASASRMTLGVAVATFALQRKLPYKRMLIVTGVMIGFVLVVMVGQTARTHAGHRLAADHADRRRSAVLARAVVRRLPDVGDDRRPGGRHGLRHRLLRPGAGGARARPAPARVARSGRVSGRSTGSAPRGGATPASASTRTAPAPKWWEHREDAEHGAGAREATQAPAR